MNVILASQKRSSKEESMMKKAAFFVLFLALAPSSAFALENSGGYRCYAMAHEGVFPKPAVWGEAFPSQKDAENSALTECARIMGFAANCRIEACFREP